MPKGGPDGGDGGRGGHVVLHGDDDVDSLIQLYFSPHLRAGNGGHGSGRQMHGANGRDCIINVPLGTQVWNNDTGEMLGDIVENGQEMRIAKGGKGGLGNIHFKSSTHQAPIEHTPGEPGQELSLRLVLKLMADIGLVGFPNAGKSSMLAKLSDARPKIAAYPFTTRNPVPGTVVFDDFTQLRMADIPGIIEGAHAGVGLGDAFLRHIERARFLLIIIDMAAVDARKPAADFECLMNELRMYNPDLLLKPLLTVANKMDLPAAARHLKTFIRKTGISPVPVSTLTGQGIEDLKARLHSLCGPDMDMA